MSENLSTIITPQGRYFHSFIPFLLLFIKKRCFYPDSRCGVFISRNVGRQKSIDQKKRQAKEKPANDKNTSTLLNSSVMYPEMEKRPLPLIIIEPAILIAMAIVCSTGNILICVSIYRNPTLRTTTNVYVLALAVSDLLNSVMVMSLAVGVLITGKWPYGEILCNMHAFFTLFSVYVSPTTMGLAAFNRYIRIVKSSRYHHIFTPFLSKLYVGAVWILVAGYVLVPRLVGWTAFGFIPGYAVCTIIHPTAAVKIVHYCIVVSLFLLLPFTVAIVCYYKVFKTIDQHNMNMLSTMQRAGHEGHISVREIKITKSLAVIVLAFGMCWIPFWIIAVIQRFTSSAVPRNIQLVCTFLLFFSSTINPFIYAGTNEVFRAEFRRVLQCSRYYRRVNNVGCSKKETTSV